MLKEFFAPLWAFLNEKLGVASLIVSPLIAILLFVLAVLLLVFILALPKLIFDAVKKNRYYVNNTTNFHLARGGHIYA